MPRKRKTLSGASASAPTMPVNSTYGEGVDAIESQRRTPVPMTAGAPSLAPAGGGGGGQAAPDPHAAAMAAAAAMAPPESILAQPTERPNEPIQTGVTQPPAVSPDPAIYELQALAQRFGYPDLVNFVERVTREA